MKGAPASLASRREISVLPTPVGPIIRMFFGITSSRIWPSSCWRRQRLRRAIATARLASFWPMMKRSSSETISRGEKVVIRSSSLLLPDRVEREEQRHCVLGRIVSRTSRTPVQEQGITTNHIGSRTASTKPGRKAREQWGCCAVLRGCRRKPMNTLTIPRNAFDPYYAGRKGLSTPTRVGDDQPARDPAPADRPQMTTSAVPAEAAEAPKGLPRPAPAPVQRPAHLAPARPLAGRPDAAVGRDGDQFFRFEHR